jgi:hypothetical protein
VGTTQTSGCDLVGHRQPGFPCRFGRQSCGADFPAYSLRVLSERPVYILDATQYGRQSGIRNLMYALGYPCLDGSIHGCCFRRQRAFLPPLKRGVSCPSF